MRRNKILLGIVTIFLFMLFCLPVSAKEPSEKEIQAILDKKQVTDVSAKAITVVTNYTELKNAITYNADNVLIMNDIYMEGTIYVYGNKDIYFLGLSSTIYAPDNDFYMFQLENGEQTFEFQDITFDGEEKGKYGFYEITKSIGNLTIKGLEMTNFNRFPIYLHGGDTGQEFNLIDCNLHDNYNISGGGGMINTYNYFVNVNGCTFTNNHTGSDGGALAIGHARYNEEDPVLKVKNSHFEGNVADRDGGAIWVPRFQAVSVDSNTTFKNNSASSGRIIRDEDIETHNELIKTSSFTTPFTYAYNNFDIFYTYGKVANPISITFYTSKSQEEPYHVADILSNFKFPATSIPENPTLDGFIFAGWMDNKGNLFDPNKTYSVNTDFYAIWFAE